MALRGIKPQVQPAGNSQGQRKSYADHSSVGRQGKFAGNGRRSGAELAIVHHLRDPSIPAGREIPLLASEHQMIRDNEQYGAARLVATAAEAAIGAFQCDFGTVADGQVGAAHRP